MSEFGAAKAEELLREWTKSESLVKHCLAVAACTESYGVREAARMGLGNLEADVFAVRYRCAGLLHDFDYEKHPTPEEHPFVGVAYLRQQGVAGGDSARDFGARGLFGREAGDASRPLAVCVR